VEFEAVKYQFVGPDLSQEKSPEKKGGLYEGNISNPQDEETKTPEMTERCRGYVDVSLALDDINLKLKNRVSPIQDAKVGEQSIESLIENS
jgi:hypothetical protein